MIAGWWAYSWVYALNLIQIHLIFTVTDKTICVLVGSLGKHSDNLKKSKHIWNVFRDHRVDPYNHFLQGIFILKEWGCQVKHQACYCYLKLSWNMELYSNLKMTCGFWVSSCRIITVIFRILLYFCLTLSFEFVGGGVVVIPSEYLVSTQLLFWSFCC